MIRNISLKARSTSIGIQSQINNLMSESIKKEDTETFDCRHNIIKAVSKWVQKDNVRVCLVCGSLNPKDLLEDFGTGKIQKVGIDYNSGDIYINGKYKVLDSHIEELEKDEQSLLKTLINLYLKRHYSDTTNNKKPSNYYIKTVNSNFINLMKKVDNMENNELTFGQKVVVPEHRELTTEEKSKINKIKMLFAEIIDSIEEDYNKRLKESDSRLSWATNVFRTLAFTTTVQAQTAVIKFLTWKN